MAALLPGCGCTARQTLRGDRKQPDLLASLGHGNRRSSQYIDIPQLLCRKLTVAHRLHDRFSDLTTQAQGSILILRQCTGRRCMGGSNKPDMHCRSGAVGLLTRGYALLDELLQGLQLLQAEVVLLQTHQRHRTHSAACRTMWMSSLAQHMASKAYIAPPKSTLIMIRQSQLKAQCAASPRHKPPSAGRVEHGCEQHNELRAGSERHWRNVLRACQGEAVQASPMSTPTAFGHTNSSDANTVPMVTPLPRCTSGMAATYELLAGSGDSATSMSCWSAWGSISLRGVYSRTCRYSGVHL